MTAPVTMYSTPICPYCSSAKRLLDSKEIEFEEIGMHDISSDERMALTKKTNNYRTVPQIFIGDTFIGGYDELNQLHQTGELDKMLNGL